MILFSCRSSCESLYDAPPFRAERGTWGLSGDEGAMGLVAEIMDFNPIACNCGESKETRKMCKELGKIVSY